jgi:hypothetical protein
MEFGLKRHRENPKNRIRELADGKVCELFLLRDLPKLPRARRKT